MSALPPKAESIGRRAIEVEVTDHIVAVPPIERLISLKKRSAGQLFVAQVDLVGVCRNAVFHPIPWHRDVLRADAHEAAESKHSVGHLAASLIDHQPLDGTDLCPVGTTHLSSFHAVAGDEAMRLIRHRKRGLCLWARVHVCLHNLGGAHFCRSLDNAARKKRTFVLSTLNAPRDEMFRPSECPLYPRKRTCAVQLEMSALGQKQTKCIAAKWRAIRSLRRQLRAVLGAQ